MRDDECTSASCRKEATHTLTTRVAADANFPEMIRETRYCLDCCLYFAAWLPYCYPGEYELVSILPPTSELFKDYEG